MSDNIVERLRFAAKDPAGTDTHVAIYRDLCAEVADEIERLRVALRIAQSAILAEFGSDRRAALAIIDAALSGKGES